MQAGSTSTSKILAILEGYNWPSGVVRARIYRDLMVRDGFDVEFIGRIAMGVADRTARFGANNKARLALIAAATHVNELRALAKARTASSIYLCKVTNLRFLRLLRRVAPRARIVLDFGDTVWLDRHGKRQDGEFGEVLKLVDAVTTDNEITAKYVRKFGKAITVIPDSPQLEAFDKRRGTVKPRTDGKVVVGWIGTDGTLYNLELIAGALRAVAAKHPEMTLRLVGVGYDRSALAPLEGLPYTVRPTYDQASMIDELFGMDIGLFPLQDIERSTVRGVLKASVYMCGEAAVIASPVGQVPDVITDGVNGLLASTPEEWMTKLDALVSDAALRTKLQTGGLAYVQNHFRTHQSWELLRAILRGEAA